MGLLNIFKNKKEDLLSLMDKETLLRLRFGTVLDYVHIKDISIILKENEYCFYKDKCVIYESKEESVGYESGYNGINFHLTSGVNIKKGKSKSKSIISVKETEYSGILYLTNKRVIFINDTKGFEKPLSAITSVQGISPILTLQINNKSFRFSTPSASEFINVFYELNLMEVDKVLEPKLFPSNVFDEDLFYENAKEDPIYYLVANGLIKNSGRFTAIQREFLPVKYRRLAHIVQSLIDDGIILDERTDEGYYKINIDYTEWITNRIKNKEY